tara:strand:+ start:20564 stop:21457 length:894 start_codon:yes stop_codon:yes gene_type:complete
MKNLSIYFAVSISLSVIVIAIFQVGCTYDTTPAPGSGSFCGVVDSAVSALERLGIAFGALTAAGAVLMHLNLQKREHEFRENEAQKDRDADTEKLVQDDRRAAMVVSMTILPIAQLNTAFYRQILHEIAYLESLPANAPIPDDAFNEIFVPPPARQPDNFAECLSRLPINIATMAQSIIGLPLAINDIRTEVTRYSPSDRLTWIKRVLVQYKVNTIISWQTMEACARFGCGQPYIDVDLLDPSVRFLTERTVEDITKSCKEANIVGADIRRAWQISMMTDLILYAQNIEKSDSKNHT